MELRKRIVNLMNTKKKNILLNRVNSNRNKVTKQREINLTNRYLELTHLKALSKR